MRAAITRIRKSRTSSHTSPMPHIPPIMSFIIYFISLAGERAHVSGDNAACYSN